MSETVVELAAPAESTCPACGGTIGPLRLNGGRDRMLGTPGDFSVAICARCSSGLTLPLVDASELGALYPEAYAPYNPAASPIGRRISALIQWWQGRQALRRPPIEALTAMAPGRVLDVGCGRGDLGALLHSRGWRVTGIEPSPSACEHARARGIDARLGTMDSVAVEAEGYDAAVFQHSLEHTLDVAGDLERTWHALRPGGLVLVSVPNFGSWQRRRFGTSWFNLELPRHRTHFTLEGLERALERAGFTTHTLATSSTTIGLPASVQYRLFGRCLFPGGLAWRFAVAACLIVLPLARALDRAAGEGDQTHAVARKGPAAEPSS